MRIMTLFFAMIIAPLILFGCATAPRTASLATPFDAAAHERFAGEGEATLAGQAFHRTVGGEIKYAAGRQVDLLPASPYGREIIEVIKSGRQVDNFADAWRPLVRKTTANGQGEFRFRGVPAGQWYVLTWNTWAPGGTMLPQGGSLGALVTIPESGEVEVILTGPPW